MSEEPTPTAAAHEGEPTSEPTPQSQPTPPAAATEEPIPSPDWLNAPLDSGGSGGYGAPAPEYPQSAGYGQQPGYYPPVPPMPPPNYGYPPQGYGYPPPQQPPPPMQRPGLSLEDLGRNPDGSIRNLAREEVMGAVGPLLQQIQQQQARLAQLDGFGQRQHEASVVRGFERARETVRGAYDQVYAKDPAFKNKAVQQRVEYATRRYLAEQVDRAYRTGDFSGLEVAATAKPYRLILAAAKEDAGWTEGAVRLEMRGAFVEGSRSQPQGAFSLSEDEKEAARQLGISDEDMWKAKEESKKRGGGL